MRHLIVIAAFVTWSLAAASPRAASSPLAQSVEAVGMTVSDMDRSMAFFKDVLTFEPISDVEVAGQEYDRLQGVFGTRMRIVRMRLGDEQIELTEYLAPRGRPIPIDSRSNDRWFQHVAIIVSDMDAAYARLRLHNVEHASPEPQRLPDWNPAAGGIKAFYFKDPDGHPLEILQFPEGKGDRRWHRSSGRLFLGIDHTAIVVSDTDTSLRFYRDVLGLRVAGESTNYGPEQERLNNVFGARLRITALRPDAGPGVELLEYLAPATGRPFPPDAAPNDLIHWHTRFVRAGVEDVAARFRRARSAFVSSGPVDLPDANTGFRKSVMVRDPDGHAVQVSEQ